MEQQKNVQKESHLGNIFDLQSVEIAAATKKLIECLDPICDLYEALLDLIRLKDPAKSTVFLLVSSLVILYLELTISVAMLGILVFIQYNAYYRRVYQPATITYVRSAQFLLLIMSAITHAFDLAE